MITIADIEHLYQHLQRDWIDVLLEIHNLVMEVSPSAATEVRRSGIVYYNAGRGGPVRAGICQSLIKPDHIRLAFIHGAFLPDPQQLLEGVTFPKRYVKILSYDTAPWEEIKALIEAHNRFDPGKLTAEEISAARHR